jgi:N-acetylglutamate synthase-like GNAT family acetyltransferase
MDNVIFIVNPTIEARDLCDLRESVGWERLDEDYPTAFKGYWASVGGFNIEGKLIGWCAILSDGVRHAVLLDMIVHPSWQRHHIGRTIVARAIAHIRSQGISIIHVDFLPEKARFYERCGFKVGLGGIIGE